MKTWKDIRWCIYSIDKSNQIYEIVISCEKYWTQSVTIWKYGTNDKKQRHTNHAHFRKFVKFLFACEEEIHASNGHISKPEQIWDDKKLHKRNVIV